MNENDNLEQEEDSKSTSSNLPIEVKENKFKSLIEDLKDPMLSWRLKEGLRDFADAVSMSALSQAFKRMFNSATNAISNFTNRIKESAENKRNNDPTKMGVNVSTIDVQNEQPKSVIMPKAPNTIIMAQAQVKADSLVDHAKSAEDVELETSENGIKLETLDSSATIEEIKKKEDMQSSMESGEININQPAKEEKEGEDR